MIEDQFSYDFALSVNKPMTTKFHDTIQRHLGSIPSIPKELGELCYQHFTGWTWHSCADTQSGAKSLPDMDDT